MARVEVVPWSIASMWELFMRAASLYALLGAGWQEGTHRQLVEPAAGDAAEERAGDRHPPVIPRRRKGLCAPAAEKAEETRPEVAGRIDRPGLEVAGTRANGSHQEPDHESPGVGGRRQGGGL